MVVSALRIKTIGCDAANGIGIMKRSRTKGTKMVKVKDRPRRRKESPTRAGIIETADKICDHIMLSMTCSTSAGTRRRNPRARKTA